MTDGDGSETPTENGDRAGTPREFVEEMAEEWGVDPDHLLIQSKRRDPMWKGTDADHAKAEWFAEWWRQAVDGREDARIHVRGVHYYMVSEDDDIEPPTNCSWGVYRNTEKCYNYLEEASVLARILGYIPLGGIIDQKHDQFTVTRYDDHRRQATLEETTVPTGISTPTIPMVEERASLCFDPGGGAYDGLSKTQSFAEYAADRLADELVDQLYFDQPQQAAYHLELWSEKSLPDYITDVATEYGVNVIVEGEGDLSLTIAHNLVQRIQAASKPAVILYLSDFDPKGDNMASAMSGKLAWLNQRGDIDQRVIVEQLAVTREQIEALDLPRKPIEESRHTGTGGKAYDTLVSDWEQRRGAGATELNALEARPDEFERIVREGLDPYVDDDIRRKNREAVEQWQEAVRDAVRDAVVDSDLEAALEDVEAWMRQFNDALRKAEPVFEGLRDMKQDSPYSEWREAAKDSIERADLPVATVPEADADLPDDPLYDSSRSYGENLVRVERHKNGDGE